MIARRKPPKSSGATGPTLAAGAIAQGFIIDDGMLVACTPETTNPLTTTCALEEIAAILTVAPRVVERLLALDFGRVIGIGDADTIMASREAREIYPGTGT